MTKIQNNRTASTVFPVSVIEKFGHSNLFRISDFDIRISAVQFYFGFRYSDFGFLPYSFISQSDILIYHGIMFF